MTRALFRTPHLWLARAIRRAESVLPHTKVYPPEFDTFGYFTARRYHERTIHHLEKLKGIDPNGPDWAEWIIDSVRLEGTCSDLRIAALESVDS